MGIFDYITTRLDEDRKKSALASFAGNYQNLTPEQRMSGLAEVDPKAYLQLVGKDFERDNQKKGLSALQGILGGEQPRKQSALESVPTQDRPSALAQVSPATPSLLGNMRSYGDAIAQKESGGNYQAVGPTNEKYGRALGRYQIMEANIPQWSQSALGRVVTPDEFLSNPEIQDQIFAHKFGEYEKKHGADGAARAWFAGEGGMNNPNAKDALGTTVQNYGDSFKSALGRLNQPETQVAAGGPIMSDATPPAVNAPMGDVDPLEDIDRKIQEVTFSPDIDDQNKKIGINILEQQRKQLLEQRKSPDIKTFENADGTKSNYQWDAKKSEWVPAKLPENKSTEKRPPKLTEQQSKDLGFYERGSAALKLLEPVEQELSQFWDTNIDKIPVVGNAWTDEKFKLAKQAGQEFLAAILRKDTGAAVTPKEFEAYGDIYLPKYGDTSAVLAQKRVARERSIEAIKSGMGVAQTIAKEFEAQPPKQIEQPKVEEQRTSGSPQVGFVSKGHRFIGGDPSKKESWELVQ